MLPLKALISSVIGAALGTAIGFAIGIAVWIVVGIAIWDSRTASNIGLLIGILCVIAGGGIGLAIPFKADADRDRSGRDARASRRGDLLELRSSALDRFRRIPLLLAEAERHLDQAEGEFSERAFALFWDEIECATSGLAMYHRCIGHIEQDLAKYRAGIAMLNCQMPPFALPMGELPDARPAAARLSAIVRKAQKEFQFATIYEQRKTNQILVEGFGTLASAIYSLGDAISSSLNDLSDALHVPLNQMLRTLDADAAAHRRHERSSRREQRRQSDILDDIRRGRKPFL